MEPGESDLNAKSNKQRFNAQCNYSSPSVHCRGPFFLMTKWSGKKRGTTFICSVLNERVTTYSKIIGGFLQGIINPNKDFHPNPILDRMQLAVLHLSLL